MDKIVGNVDARLRLRDVLFSTRCPHAFVISGPRGVGKFTFILKVAHELLNTVEEGHPDLHVIKKEDVVWSSNPVLRRKKQTNIPVDLLRERMIGGTTSDGSKHGATVYKTPVAGDKKVFVVDEAELLDESGQNALLKTLEEPPEDTVIFLITSREDKLLKTVLSRCQPHTFGPLNTDEMLQWAELVGRGGPMFNWLCEWSCGSPGVFEEGWCANVFDLFEDVSPFLQNPEAVELVGVIDRVNDFLNSRQEFILSKNQNASKESVNRRGVELVLRLFEWQARQYIHNKGVGNRVGLGILCSEMISEVEQQGYANISTKVLIESLIVRWKQLCLRNTIETVV